MAKINPPCAPECPGRSPGCHNPETCPAWREYLARKAERDAAIRTARDDLTIVYDYRKRVLQRSKSRRNVKNEGRNHG